MHVLHSKLKFNCWQLASHVWKTRTANTRNGISNRVGTSLPLFKRLSVLRRGGRGTRRPSRRGFGSELKCLPCSGSSYTLVYPSKYEQTSCMTAYSRRREQTNVYTEISQKGLSEHSISTRWHGIKIEPKLWSKGRTRCVHIICNVDGVGLIWINEVLRRTNNGRLPPPPPGADTIFALLYCAHRHVRALDGWWS